ncbi:MAG: hypothetical protein JKY65_28945, partial [Planctomycetes bacterium]|nr:hypothetical protein [Planctomycetota bacterium]
MSDPSASSPPTSPEPATPEALARAARLRRNYLAVGASALMSFAAFPPFDVGFLAYLALVPLLFAGGIDRLRVAAGLAYAATVLYHLTGLSWLAMTSPPGWLVITSLEGFYGVALICLPLWVRRRTGTPLVLALPLFGVALECIRGNCPWIALPWLFWGHTQHAQLTLIQIVDVTSVYGLSAIVLAVNGAIADVALLLRARNEAEEDLSGPDLKRLRWVVALPIFLIILALTYGYLRRGQVREAMEAAGPGPRLLLVQPDLPQTLKESGSAVAAANESLRGSKIAIATAGGKIDGLLWTETMWFWPLPDYRRGAVGNDPEGNELDGRRVYEKWRAGYLRWGDALSSSLKHFRAAQAGGDAGDRAMALGNLKSLLRIEGDQTALVRFAQEAVAECRGFQVVEAELLALPAKINAPVFVGAVDLDIAHRRANPHNSYYQLVPNGLEPATIAARYDKIECVPVSEYIPFKKEDSALHGFHKFMKSFVPAGFQVFARGEAPVLMDAGGFKLSPNICFEISFPELLRRGTAAGADVLVCPANDAWFVHGDRGQAAIKTGELDLARSHSVFRAIENRRSVVRCVNRGVSLCVDPTGVVIDEISRPDPRTGKSINVGIDGSLVVQPPITHLMSFYVRFGNVFPGTCSLGALAFLICAWRERRLFSPTEGTPKRVLSDPAPAEEADAPAEESDAPEEADAPAEGSDASAEESAAPTEETQAPAEETQAPPEGSDAPTEETQAPVEEADAPTEGSDAPAEEGAA